MKLTKPKFWETRCNFFSILLLPFTLILIILISIKKKITKVIDFNIPIICVGNLFIGGTGKTPISILIGKELSKINRKPVIVKKFYKSHEDEHELIKSHFNNLILKQKREVAINDAKNMGYDTVILDDGFQDYKIKKDLNILCFHENQLIGNGFVFPAGPLRESLHAIKDVDIIIINGRKNIDFEEKLLNLNRNIAIFYSKYQTQDIDEFRGKNLLAFAGIGNPENFFNLLSKDNLIVEKKLTFPDHYKFSKIEIQKIIDEAKNNNYQIIMTEKDYFKINHYNLKEVNYLKVSLVISEIEKLISRINKI